MNNITLYYAPDNASLIVRMVLEELQLPYQSVLVDRGKNEQQGDEFLRLNPTGLIPVCVIDNAVLTETAAIMLYLAETAQSTLAPEHHAPERASFLRWLFFLSNTLHADLRQLFYAHKYVGSDAARQQQYRDAARQRITANLQILEQQYQHSAQCYLFGESPTLVDIYLAVCLRWLQLYPLADRGWFTFPDYPALLSMAGVLQQRPALIKACQPDGIGNDFFTQARDAKPTAGSAL